MGPFQKKMPEQQDLLDVQFDDVILIIQNPIIVGPPFQLFATHSASQKKNGFLTASLKVIIVLKVIITFTFQRFSVSDSFFSTTWTTIVLFPYQFHSSMFHCCGLQKWFPQQLGLSFMAYLSNASRLLRESRRKIYSFWSS